jgi:hypothetical protein
MGEGKLGFELLKQILEGGYKKFLLSSRRQAFSMSRFDSVIKIQTAIDWRVIASPDPRCANPARMRRGRHSRRGRYNFGFARWVTLRRGRVLKQILPAI